MTTTRTNLGPLTTEFVYPSSCTVAILKCSTCPEAWQGQVCSDNRGNDQGVQDNPGCWPPRDARTTTLSTGVALNGWGFYSPGISCPKGYETSCLATYSVDGGWGFQFPLTKGETAVGCCPPGYRCKYNPGVETVSQTCYSIATNGSFPAAQCSSGTSNGFNYLSMPATVTAMESGETTTKVMNTMTVYAPLIQLMRQSSDLASSEATDSGSVSAATLDGSISTNALVSDEFAPALSTGAKAGIGIGASVGALALIGAVAFFFLKRRKRMTPVPGEEPVSERPKQEQLGPELEAPTPPSELYSEGHYRAARSELE